MAFFAHIALKTLRRQGEDLSNGGVRLSSLSAKILQSAIFLLVNRPSFEEWQLRANRPSALFAKAFAKL
jgi:hypothetical protein